MNPEAAEEKLRIENNDMLIDYYRNQFGFERYDDIKQNGDLLYSTLQLFNEKCTLNKKNVSKKRKIE